MADAKTKKKLPSGRHLSQIKRQRQNEKRMERNRRIRSDYRTYVKKVREAVASKDDKGANTALAEAKKRLHKAVSKGVLHANNASRKVSRLSKLVATLKS